MVGRSDFDILAGIANLNVDAKRHRNSNYYSVIYIHKYICNMYIYMYIYTYIYMCVCPCVCFLLSTVDSFSDISVCIIFTSLKSLLL